MAAFARQSDFLVRTRHGRFDRFVGEELGDAARHRHAMVRAGLHRRAHALGDLPRFGAAQARQDHEQLVAIPLNGQIGSADRSRERLAHGLERIR